MTECLFAIRREQIWTRADY